nr:MAG TPA: hypothetical protein [Caudoviricetes sp.]
MCRASMYRSLTCWAVALSSIRRSSSSHFSFSVSFCFSDIFIPSCEIFVAFGRGVWYDSCRPFTIYRHKILLRTSVRYVKIIARYMSNKGDCNSGAIKRGWGVFLLSGFISRRKGGI